MIIKNKETYNPEIIDNGEASGINFFPMITAGDGAPNFAMRLFEVKAGGHTPRHQHEWEHEIYIISGDGYALSGEKKIRVSPGDFIFIESLELHQLQAGDSGISFICVVPNSGQPCTDCGNLKNIIDDITRKVLKDLGKD